MIPVKQTVTGKHGNCFSACLASLFELPISEVPNFFDFAGDDDAKWWAAVRDWLSKRGFGVMFLELKSPAHLSLFAGYIIVSGKSCRGLDHATIWKDGKMVHDPHPDNRGIETPDGVDMIYPLDLSKLVLRDKPETSSKFSEFIRNAPLEEKERVYQRVMKQATEDQNALMDKPTQRPPVCHWQEDSVDEGWNTSCGEKHLLIDGTPTDNHMHFCCYCGGELTWEREKQND